MKRAPKYIRVVVSLIMLTVAAAFAAGCGSLFGIGMGWINSIQFLPVVLAVSIPTVILWLVATFLFGRIYCSSVCPLGTLQDIFLRIPRLTKSQRNRRPFRFAVGLSTFRLSALVVVFGSLIAGFTVPATVLDPFSIFCELVRIPIGSALAMASVAMCCCALAIVFLIAIMSARKGRLWCNTLCPVGAVLGLVSRYSIFHFDINTDLCTNCRKCEYECKAQCINLDDHTVDGSRCVNCFNCTLVCPNNAITYTTRRHKLSLPMMQSISEVRSSMGK